MTSHHNYVMRSDWEIGSINFTIEDFSEMERIPFSLQLHNVQQEAHMMKGIAQLGSLNRKGGVIMYWNYAMHND